MPLPVTEYNDMESSSPRTKKLSFAFAVVPRTLEPGSDVLEEREELLPPFSYCEVIPHHDGRLG